MQEIKKPVGPYVGEASGINLATSQELVTVSLFQFFDFVNCVVLVGLCIIFVSPIQILI